MGTMGEFAEVTNTQAPSLIYKIVNTLGWIAGIACVAMILFSLVKIMTGDEGDRDQYLTRIKHGIVAFILILTITNVVVLVTRYFKMDMSTYAGTIGDFHAHYNLKNDGLTKTLIDKKSRPMIVIGDEVFVCTGNKKIDMDDRWDHWFDVHVDVYKYFDECQGWDAGSNAPDRYYIFQYRDGDWMGQNELDKNTEQWSVNFMFPATWRNTIGNVTSKEDWNYLKWSVYPMDNQEYHNNDKSYHPQYKIYTADNNPYVKAFEGEDPQVYENALNEGQQ